MRPWRSLACLMLRSRKSCCEQPPAVSPSTHQRPRRKGMPKTPEDRLLGLVEKTDTCWIWTARKTRGGYGRLTVDGKTAAAHRFAYSLFIGDIPHGMFVCHRCDSPAC